LVNVLEAREIGAAEGKSRGGASFFWSAKELIFSVGSGGRTRNKTRLSEKGEKTERLRRGRSTIAREFQIKWSDDEEKRRLSRRAESHL